MAQKFEKYLLPLPVEIHFIRKWLSHCPGNFNFENANVVPPVNYTKVLDVIKNHRVYPAVYKALSFSIHENEITIDIGFLNTLKALVEKNRLQMLQKASTLVKILQAFNTSNIPVVSLKGPALAAQLYGDVGMKASLDLDILIPKDQFAAATQILRELNFNPQYNFELTPRKQNYLLNNFHHISYTGEAGNIELHWELNTNRFMTGRKNDFYFDNTDTVILANKNIPVLNKRALLEYLAIHGSYHAWARLDWLYDFSTLISQSQTVGYEVGNSMRAMGNYSIYSQSIALSHFIFGTSMPGPIELKNKLLMTFPLKHMAQPYKNSKNSVYYKWFQKIYLFQLKRKWRYRLHIFSVLGTNQGDWDMLRLPDPFFFLYFFLRPFLFVFRIFKNR